MTEDEALQIIAETIVRGEDSGANGWQTAAEILAALRADPALAAAALGGEVERGADAGLALETLSRVVGPWREVTP